MLLDLQTEEEQAVVMVALPIAHYLANGNLAMALEGAKILQEHNAIGVLEQIINEQVIPQVEQEQNGTA